MIKKKKCIQNYLSLKSDILLWTAIVEKNLFSCFYLNESEKIEIAL